MQTLEPSASALLAESEKLQEHAAKAPAWQALRYRRGRSRPRSGAVRAGGVKVLLDQLRG